MVISLLIPVREDTNRGLGECQFEKILPRMHEWFYSCIRGNIMQAIGVRILQTKKANIAVDLSAPPAGLEPATL